MNEETVPFDVQDEVSVGDLTAVQADILPVAQNVRVRIDKAAIDTSKDKALKSLKLELAIVDGIQIGDEMKYQNKKVFPGFMDLCIWADPAVKSSNWYKTKQHLLGFKQLCQALQIELSNVKVNDEFTTSLLGRELLINIGHEEETVLDPNTGKRIKTGTLRERIRGFKRAL